MTRAGRLIYLARMGHRLPPVPSGLPGALRCARVASAIALLLVGCRTATPRPLGEENSRSERGEPHASATTTVASATASSATSVPATSASPLPRASPEDAKLPFTYPAAPTTARAGDRVLAPPQRWVKNALAAGTPSQSFVYFAARMVSPGPEASVIEVAGGALEALPNALLIALPPGERAQVGDLLLTAWASGTGMQRAIVVEGGTPEAPHVAYLDLDYDHPSGAGKRTESLPPGTFRPLTEAGAVGTSLECDEGGRRVHHVVVHRADPHLLGLGFGGRLRPLESARCRPIPLRPRIEAGTLLVPVLGVLTPARARHLEAEIGRVFVRYAAGKKDHDAAVGILNVVVQ